MLGEAGMGEQRRLGGFGQRLGITENLLQRHSNNMFAAELEQVFRRRVEITDLQIPIEQDHGGGQVFQSGKEFSCHGHIIPGWLATSVARVAPGITSVI